MEELMLFIQLCLVIAVFWMLRGMRKTLWRVEQIQGTVREQIKKLQLMLDRLHPSQKPAVLEPAEKQKTSVRVDVPPPMAENVKIELPQPVFSEPAKRPLSAQPPPLVAETKHSPEERAPQLESPIVSNAREMLARIWSWILWGQEERPVDVSMEYALATTWLPRVGVAVLAACGGWVLMWSYNEGFMGPTARVALIMLSGAGMIVAGLRLRDNKYNILGQSLLGGGLLLLYLSIYTAGPREHIIPVILAFALMMLVTVSAWLIAIRVNTQLVAILGIAGGFMTPVLLSTGAADFPVLFSYMLMLNLGILAVSHSRHWPLLNYLGFVLTYVIALAALDDSYKVEMFPLVISFLTAFFIIHSVIVYLYNIQRRRPSSALEIVHLVANGGVYGGLAYFLIRDAHGGNFPAIMSIGMALFYIGHVAVFLRRKLDDRGLLVALIALAGAFTAWTLPIVFQKETLTIAFALLAFTLLFIGKRIGSRFMENLSHLLYGVVFVRLFGDMHRNFAGHAIVTGAEYWKTMVGRLWTFGIAIASIGAAFHLEQVQPTKAPLVRETSDTGKLITTSKGTQLFYWATILFLFLFLHLEVNAMFGMWTAFRLPALTALWSCMGFYFLYKICKSQTASTAMLIALAAFAMGSFMKVIAVDLISWNFSDLGYFDMAYTGQAVLARMVDFGSLLLLLGCAWGMMPSVYPRPTRSVFGYGTLGFLFLYTTLELNSLLHWRLLDFQSGGITALWAVFAIAFTGGGIWRNVKPLRYVGLILFAIVVGKVFIHDLSHMPMIFRVIAFFVVGIALLLGSFAYVFANKKFIVEEGQK